MKTSVKNQFVFLVLAMLGFVSVKADENVVKSKIDHVTVYIQGARIDRVSRVAIPKGPSELVFDDLSPYLLQNSLQASGKGSFTITDIRYRMHYPKPLPTPEIKIPESVLSQIDEIQDSLKRIDLRLKRNSDILQAIKKERDMILNHPLIKGTSKRDSFPILEQSSQFLKDRLIDLADRTYINRRSEYDLLRLRAQGQKKLNELQQYANQQPKPSKRMVPKHQVIVSIIADRNQTAQIKVMYNVRNAGWKPVYDLKAEQMDKDVDLVYKASVYQQTGEDWNNTKLTISNVNPNRGNVKPVLPVWYIRYYNRAVLEAKKSRLRTPMMLEKNSVEAISVKDIVEDEDEMKEAVMSDDYTSRVQNFSSVEFKIDLPYTIKSAGKQYQVVLKKAKIKSHFEHYLVPKLDPNAFVMARLTEWEDLDLLLGDANVYFGNTYVGRTVLDPTVLTDTLSVSFGRDMRIVSEYKVKDVENKNKLFTDDKLYAATNKISIRNNHKNSINLIVEDQIPLSVQKEIQVELLDDGGASLNESTGMMNWRVVLNPRSQKEMEFRFEVVYPAAKQLSGLM